MQNAITIAFQLFWIVTFGSAVIVGLLARRPAGRRRLRRWIKLPTIIWWEVEREVTEGDDVGATISELRESIPGANHSLLPPFCIVHISEPAGRSPTVVIRTATLMQSKTSAEAMERICNGLAPTLEQGKLRRAPVEVAAR
jgi:hypothetical protein